MILIKETIKQFGYDPRSLAKFSTKRVVVRCTSCKKEFTLNKGAYERKLSEDCKKCASKKSLVKIINTRSEKLIKLAATEKPDIEKLSWLVFSGNISKGRTHTELPGIKLHFGPRGVTRIRGHKALAIFNLLNLDTAKVTTKTLKIAALNYILNNLSKPELAKVLFFVLNKFNKGSVKIVDKNAYYIGDANKRLEPILAALDFEFTRNKNYLRVTRGSFYIKNRWIHIGD